MKNLVVLITLFSIFFVSCEKDEEILFPDFYQIEVRTQDSHILGITLYFVDISEDCGFDVNTSTVIRDGDPVSSMKIHSEQSSYPTTMAALNSYTTYKVNVVILDKDYKKTTSIKFIKMDKNIKNQFMVNMEGSLTKVN